MTPTYLTLLGVLGLVVGSFLNVVIHRVPAGLSIVSPGSACPACSQPVRAYDNVPVVSWLLLGGRCRDCSSPIAVRYPLVELATGLLFVVAGWRFGPTAYAAATLVVVAAGVALVMIDIDHRRLPFSVTSAMAVGTALTLAIDAVLHGAAPLIPALLSAALWVGVYGGIWLVTSGRGMGLGDVALAPVLGLALGWLGWGSSLIGLGAGFVVGAVVGGVLIVTGRARRGAPVPHGPNLLTGALLGLFAGAPLAAGYLSLVGLG